ncbi:lytic transglycosylase domain-containing protein [Mycobacterium sp. KBS0706]|uniref:lytic transglycosylase domain-containing protein n=1 Tax=Mycobacterium sp. KBS0706 TaxID=2578109 RepID=UPI001C8F6767|nr:lytic transglycosylase domain-containing protein [Mycobacterium sp. KBS0706]
MPGTIRWTRTVAATALLAGLLAACAQAPKPKPVVASGPWGAEIHDASRRFNIPEEWIRAVMHVESGGQTHWKGGQPITSHAGAMGLMQVMPGTYDELRYAHGLGPDAYEPRDNILAGAAYIREMYDLYGYPGFLGAYNAGPERYRQYVEEGRPLPRETERYMDIIAPQIAGIMPGQGGSDRMTQYAAAQIQQKVPAPIRMAPIPDGSSSRNATVVAAMKPIPDGSSTRGATVVAAMQPIPDGSSTRGSTVVAAMQPIPDGSSTVVASALPPVRVVQQPGVVRMQPIPDGASTQVAAAAPVARPAPVRMAPIPDGSTQVAAAAPVAVRPAMAAPVRMAPIPDAPAAQVAAAVPAPVARTAVAPTRMAPIPDAPPVRVAAAAKPARAPALQQVADADVPRRQANGLPTGWFVPSAPGN